MFVPDSDTVFAIEKRILNETVAANRNAAALAAIILALAGAALFATMQDVREVPEQTVVLLVFGLGLLFALPIIMVLRPKEDAYPVVRFWVGLVGFIIAGQIINFLFGEESRLITERGWPPLLINGIPLFLLIARAFLIKSHARFMQWFFLVMLAFAATLHWYINYQQADSLYGMSLLLITVFLVGPLIILLLDLQLRVQGTAYRALQAELLHLQRQQDAEHQMHLIDELTGLLNRQGAQEALELSLAANELTGLANMTVSNADSIRQFCEPDDFASMLRQVAGELKTQGGFQLVAGRWSEASFLLWGKISESEQQWAERMAEVLAAVEERFSSGHLLPDLHMETGIAKQGESVNLALAALHLD